MSGTIINTVTIIIGSLIGLLIKRGINKEIEEAMLKAIGLAVFSIAIIGLITNSVNPSKELLISSNELLLIISLALGMVIGEVLKIDSKINNLGLMFETKYNLGNFAKGYVSASIIFCAGAMAVFGPFANVLDNNIDILLVKSVLDGVCSLVLASALGVGVLFSSISVLLYQGFFALLANLLADVITVEMMGAINLVGYAIILTIGMNQLKMCDIKTANLIPALIIPVIYLLIF